MTITGSMIRETRTALVLRQDQFGTLLGVSGPCICQWETDKRRPPALTAIVIRQMHWLLLEAGPKRKFPFRARMREIVKDARSRPTHWTCFKMLDAVFRPIFRLRGTVDQADDQADVAHRSP